MGKIIYTFRILQKTILFKMQEGVVKFFNETKGFGFIIPNSGESEIFVHVSGLVDKVRENDQVSYEVEQGRKGLNAVNVKLI
ncbi:cold shock protein (beta-ribbon, CspA family) [Sphingobacterium psychroaquaticum]|uniref:Cold shock protein (Beta-ribbon, CspA family) n=2 Tax=Sphingobacterium psychroaquaticum TaxID=561061 RepID=A0A1X7L0P8_9SPHI|nr:cold shock protein (beta-ribbon, CspA family) [Sphingobacterium psychroaquaticum]